MQGRGSVGDVERHVLLFRKRSIQCSLSRLNYYPRVLSIIIYVFVVTVDNDSASVANKDLTRSQIVFNRKKICSITNIRN